MDTNLSRAIAAVVDREVGDNWSARAAFIRRSGVDKSTFSRKIRGHTDKVSVDEADAWAAGLGWSLTKLLREARELQAQRTADPGLPADAYRLAADVGERERPFTSQE